MDDRGRTNLTVTVPEGLVRRFRVYAAEHNQSMSSLIVQAMAEMVDRGSNRAKAADRLIARMKKSPGRGLRDNVTWTRDEIHER